MTFGRGLYYCKNIKFFQNVEKKIVILKVHDRNREGLNMSENLFSLHNVLREEKGLQPVSIAFNHCVTLFSDFV